MAKQSSVHRLVKKALFAAHSAIELYNKPTFQYKNESFVILMTNAWELLLKAKLLEDNPKNQNVIYIQSKTKTKTGLNPKRFYPKKNRTGNLQTIDIFEALRKTNLQDRNLNDQIETIVELRDNSIHFMNDDSYLDMKLFQIATATTRSFVQVVREWFPSFNNIESVLPISFTVPDSVLTISPKSNSLVQRLLKYVEKVERKKRPTTEHAIAFQVDVQLKRNIGTGAVVRNAGKNDKNAVPIKITDLDLIESKYKYDYDQLKKACKKRKANIKFDKRFMSIYKLSKESEEICLTRPLDPRRPNSIKKLFFSEQAVDFILARL